MNVMCSIVTDYEHLLDNSSGRQSLCKIQQQYWVKIHVDILETFVETIKECAMIKRILDLLIHCLLAKFLEFYKPLLIDWDQLWGKTWSVVEVLQKIIDEYFYIIYQWFVNNIATKQQGGKLQLNII